MFITHREEAGCTLMLYQIDAFYVELTYDPEMHKIVGPRSFLNTNQLEPYLKDVKLPPFH